MPFRFRKRVRLGFLPVWVNASRAGLSWSVRLGPWSWNSRTRCQRVDLPGPLSWEEPGGGPSTRRQARSDRP
jgi:hypothetical protein